MVLMSLEREIINAKSFTDQFNVRKGHSLRDHTIIRFIWGAIASADAILTLAKNNKFNGMYPSARYLLETTFTLNYILGSNNSDKIAARIFVWEITQKEKAEKSKSSLSKESSNIKKFEAIVPYKAICKELKSLGEKTQFVEDAFQEATTKKNVHWHWSGKGPGALLKYFNAKIGIQEIDLEISKFYNEVWSMFSSEVHATARWVNSYITSPLTSEFKLKDPLENDLEKSAACAGFSGNLIKTMINDAQEFYSKNTF